VRLVLVSVLLRFRAAESESSAVRALFRLLLLAVPALPVSGGGAADDDGDNYETLRAVDCKWVGSCRALLELCK